MTFVSSEWLNLIFRWIHVFAGILWIGQTYYFTWLDGRFAEVEKAGGKETGVWMVHSGGFYVVEKRKGLNVLPGNLHWFRWEAALTWLSGFILLIVVYYLGGALVDESVAPISVGAGTAIGVGALIAGWVAYDLLAQTRLVQSEGLFAVVSFVLVVAATFGLCRVLSGRAAYIHIGALFGTIMAANVWVRILPAQRRMIAAIQEGLPPDLTLAARAKLRSKHNTFMAVPVVFIMISNHFPATYGSSYNWAILAALIVVGWGAAKLIRRA